MEEMWKRVDLHEIRVNDNPPPIPEYNNRRKSREQEVTFSLKSFMSVRKRLMHDRKKRTLSLLIVASIHRG